MSIYEFILKRRSIRRFQQESIPLNVLVKMVNAARIAPSAANMQPLEYIIVDNPEQVEQIFPTLNWAGYIKPAGNPPEGEQPTAYIIILANTKIRPNGYNQEAGAAIENMILVALEEGIGSCWLESIDRAALSEIFDLPEDLAVSAVLALGYPNEEPVMEELSEPNDSIKYWKDEKGQLHIPKRRLDTVMHYNQLSQPCPLPSGDEKWERVMETSIEEEAYLAHGFLKNNGIPCFLENLKFHELPVNFGDMSKIRLLVPQDKLKEAQKLLEERDVLQEEDLEE